MFGMGRLLNKEIRLFLILFSSLLFSDTSVIAQESARVDLSQLKLPAGFSMNLYAQLNNGDKPRFMAFGPDGNLYVALLGSNQVVMLPDKNKDGVADSIVQVASGLNRPNSIAFVQGELLISNQNAVVKAATSNPTWPINNYKELIPNLPDGGHALKTVKLGPDGFLYLNVGSSCNVCTEFEPLRATILRYSIDGKPAGALQTFGRHAPNPVWASGLRNSQGFAWHPQTKQMYATNDGADMRSDQKGGAVNDELPPEHLNLIESGQHYGWPYCWGNQQPDPNVAGSESFCKDTRPPEITFTSHSTPLGITFLDKSNFPSEYKQDAIVALHGSWNRLIPSGYKLVRVKFEQNKPVSVSDFVTGWMTNAGAIGRPVDVIVGSDGALYVSDDKAAVIYKISYKSLQ